MTAMTIIYFHSRIFEPSLAAYDIDLPDRFLVSVVSASDRNGTEIMDNPVQNGVRIPFTEQKVVILRQQYAVLRV